MICPLCKREVPEHLIEDHHLIPKSKKGKDTIEMCCMCHDQIHEMFTNKELGKKLFTIELLLQNEKIQKWIGFASKQKHFNICMAKKKRNN